MTRKFSKLERILGEFNREAGFVKMALAKLYNVGTADIELFLLRKGKMVELNIQNKIIYSIPWEDFKVLAKNGAGSLSGGDLVFKINY